MIYRKALPGYLMFTLLSVLTANTHAENREVLLSEAKTIIASFSTELKTQLQAAVKAGGLVNGIEACYLKSPEISSQFSQGKWQVGRTSLKPRNVSNTPSASEVAILQSFDIQLEEGKAISELVHLEYDTDGRFHLMKAIPTGELCLACHGQTLSQNVEAVLSQKYPEDKATGYQKGEVRGAFSLYYQP